MAGESRGSEGQRRAVSTAFPPFSECCKVSEYSGQLMPIDSIGVATLQRGSDFKAVKHQPLPAFGELQCVGASICRVAVREGVASAIELSC